MLYSAPIVTGDRPAGRGFFAELRQYLGGTKRWMMIPLLLLALLVLVILVFGALEALPFLYDDF
jgi:hypothetical protein